MSSHSNNQRNYDVWTKIQLLINVVVNDNVSRIINYKINKTYIKLDKTNSIQIMCMTNSNIQFVSN